jgi:hypothetical protein
MAEVIKGKLQTASREFTTRVHDIPRQHWESASNYIKRLLLIRKYTSCLMKT